MRKTIQDYYHLEMQSLNEFVQDFTTRHPSVAADMSLDTYSNRDPHIERLLEGSAYLNARVKQQIDLGIHHVSEAFLRHLAPEYLMPRPAKTIVQFTSFGNRLIEPEWVPAGVRLCSTPVGEEQTVCQFSTLHEILVQPVTLNEIRSFPLEQGGTCLQLSFQFNEGVSLSSCQIGRFILYIDANPFLAKRWFYYLTHDVARVRVKSADGHEQEIGGQEQVTGEALRQIRSPASCPAHGVFELLNDYFQFPERFGFVRLIQDPLHIKTQTFTVQIEFSSRLSEMRLSPQLFKLHCVPAVNLYPVSCEPIRYHRQCREYPLILNHRQRNSIGLYALTDVRGMNKQTAQSIELVDFYKLSKTMPHQACYRQRQTREKDNLTRDHLVFSGEIPDELSISCEVLAFNGHYPHQYLHANGLFLKDERVCAQLQATNVNKPSCHFYPVFDSHYARQVLAATQVRFETLTTPEGLNLNAAVESTLPNKDKHFSNLQHMSGDRNDSTAEFRLKQLLGLHDWSEHSAHLIHAIQSVVSKPFSRVSKGGVMRGICVSFTVKEEGANQIPELYSFGTMLYRLFRVYLPMNTQLEVVLTGSPSGRTLTWDPYFE